MDYFSGVILLHNKRVFLKAFFVLLSLQLGDRRIVHNLKLIAFSAVITVNISLAITLIDFFYL